MGKSGLSALEYLAQKSQDQLFAINRGEPSTWAGDDVLKHISLQQCFAEEKAPQDLDLIILSPGVDRKSPQITSYIERGVDVISEIELAAKECSLPIIAITGSNGKTTTTSMISLALQKAGKRVFCGGNIGVPFCEMYKGTYDFAVLELSSFQLESVRDFHAQVAIILNITPTHMERYDDVQDYINAKLNITKNQTQDDLLIAPQKYLTGQATFNCIRPLAGYDFSHTRLVGEHHKQNLYCVREVLRFFKLDNVKEIVQDLISNFAGVEFRMQVERKTDGLIIINDAKSTNIDATISGIESFKDLNTNLILGGQLRSSQIDFIQALDSYDFECIYVYGEAADLLHKEMSAKHQVVKMKGLEDVVQKLGEHAPKGVILYSPAFPSFDQYENYQARGKHFSSLVSQYL